MTGISNGKTSSETKQHAKEALAIAEKALVSTREPLFGVLHKPFASSQVVEKYQLWDRLKQAACDWFTIKI